MWFGFVIVGSPGMEVGVGVNSSLAHSSVDKPDFLLTAATPLSAPRSPIAKIRADRRLESYNPGGASTGYVV